jgi:putative hydrolase of the HAD superfamily
MKFQIIAFDADDTLWENEVYYRRMRARFVELLSPHADPVLAGRRLDALEMDNVHWYGYGIKSFTLSMIETALELTSGQSPGSVVRSILGFGREMLSHPVELFEGVEQVLAELKPFYTLALVTKGDLLEQGRKVQRSGLASYFDRVEIVHEKTPQGYREMLERHQIPPAAFLMVGNSLKSDILPVIEIGAQAVYVPYEHTWVLEAAQVDAEVHQFHEIASLQQLPALLKSIDNRS